MFFYFIYGGVCLVDNLEDIKGYSKLPSTDKFKYAIALQVYLDTIEPEDLKLMDIIKVVAHSFKKSTYKTIFSTNNVEFAHVIVFKKSMLKGLRL